MKNCVRASPTRNGIHGPLRSLLGRKPGEANHIHNESGSVVADKLEPACQPRQLPRANDCCLAVDERSGRHGDFDHDPKILGSLVHAGSFLVQHLLLLMLRCSGCCLVMSTSYMQCGAAYCGVWRLLISPAGPSAQWLVVPNTRVQCSFYNGSLIRLVQPLAGKKASPGNKQLFASVARGLHVLEI